MTLTAGSWHTMDLVAVADSIQFYLDGALTLYYCRWLPGAATTVSWSVSTGK